MTDFATAAITSTTQVEALAPSCFDQLTSFNLDLGHMTNFDRMMGMVILTEGSVCWDDMREAFQALAAFIEEQLALAAGETLGEDAIEAATEISADVADAAEEATGLTAIIESIDEYTEAHMMVSMWAWEPEDVLPGESAGVCVKPAENEVAHTSCWMWTRDEEGVYSGDVKSYLLDPTVAFTAESRLEDQQELVNLAVPAMSGSWLCTQPMEILGMMRTTCARFLPREDSTEDPVYLTTEEVTVMTYLSSRLTGRIQEPKAFNGNQGTMAQNQAFEEFKITLGDTLADLAGDAAAINSLGLTMVGLVTALATLTF